MSGEAAILNNDGVPVKFGGREFTIRAVPVRHSVPAMEAVFAFQKAEAKKGISDGEKVAAILTCAQALLECVGGLTAEDVTWIKDNGTMPELLVFFGVALKVVTSPLAGSAALLAGQMEAIAAQP